MRLPFPPKLVRGLLLLALLPVLPSCTTLSYYGQSIGGHMSLMAKATPVGDVLKRQDVMPGTRERLELAVAIRRFAVTEMRLPDNGSYLTYADLGRPYATWNVVVAEPFSVFPRRWCYAFVGCMSYRGYFKREDALAEARLFSEQGLDVFVSGSRAYSTLGWFDDPLTNIMLDQPEATLVYLLNHELAHQLLYIKGDSAFNEAFATAVGREALRRWFARQGEQEVYDHYMLAEARRKDFNAMLFEARRDLAALYDGPLPEEEKHLAKAALFAELKGARYLAFKTRWDGYAGFDGYMQRDLNNAHLSMVATYNEYVPAFEALLREADGDLPTFYAAATSLGELPPLKRNARLTALNIPLDTAMR